MFGYTGLKLKTISCILLICLLLFSPYNSQNNPISEEMKYQPFSQSVLHMNQLLTDPYWKISSSIIIGYDSNFTDYEFPGNGTKENPYLIEDLSITTSESLGIYIFNTTKHFIIKDCYISAVVFGIVLHNVSTSSASVINTTCCYHTIYGLLLDSSDDATIYNNSFHHNIAGLGLYNSSYGNITSNSCYSNGYVDIYIIESDYSLIQHNQGTNTRFGIGILNSQFSEISDNDLDIHESSIRIVSSSFINITDNICFFNNFGGISIDSSSDILILNNICVYSSYGIFIERSTNFTIKQNDCSRGYEGITLKYSNIISVLNNTCTGYTRGAYFDKTLLTNIIGNTFSNNSEGGMVLNDCDNAFVSENVCSNNGYSGIRSNSNIPVNIYPIITSNICENNYYGIIVSYADAHTITNNTCIKNTYGIYLRGSSFSLIASNLLLENIRYGIAVADASITEASNGNKIFSNKFVDNNLDGTPNGYAQAFDEGFNNHWYDKDTNTGNFWSDWDGTGTYLIDGERMSSDPYPTNDFTTTETTSTSETSTTISTASTSDSTTDTSSGFIIQLFTLIILIAISLKKRLSKKNST